MEDDHDSGLAPSSSSVPVRVVSFLHFQLQKNMLTAYEKPPNLQWRTSVHIEDVDDDEDAYPRNVAPLNPSHLLELSDGSDDEELTSELPDLIEVDDDSEDEDEEDEESAEEELGQ